MSTARRKRYLQRWIRYRWRCRQVGGMVTIRRDLFNSAVAFHTYRYRSAWRDR